MMRFGRSERAGTATQDIASAELATALAGRFRLSPGEIPPKSFRRRREGSLFGLDNHEGAMRKARVQIVRAAAILSPLLVRTRLSPLPSPPVPSIQDDIDSTDVGEHLPQVSPEVRLFSGHDD